MHLYVKLFEQK